MNRKLLAMDIDGTAVRDDNRLGQLSKQAINRARQAGHVIAFVTGRRDVDMLSMEREERCVDYLILNNGGKILCCGDERVLMNAFIDPESCKELITHCLDNHLQLQICSGLLWQVNHMTESTKEYAKSLGILPKLFYSLEDTPWKSGIEGFMATRDWRPIAVFIEKHLPQVCYVHSEPQCIDIMAIGVSKWKGIMTLANLTDILREDIITVGNYYNDIEMIHMAATGVAVANAIKEVKLEANYVTERDNNHDAIAEVITRFCNIAPD